MGIILLVNIPKNTVIPFQDNISWPQCGQLILVELKYVIISFTDIKAQIITNDVMH